MTDNMQVFTKQAMEWLMSDGILVVVILIAMFLALSFLKRGLKNFHFLMEGRLPDQAAIKRAKTLTEVLGDLFRVVIILVALMLVCSHIGIDLAPLLMAAGVGGIALGFGAQSLVKDVITGFFILLENQVRVGDVVNIAGVGGLVEDVGLRTISLRDLSGNVHIVPNGTINTVTNMTKDYSRYVFNVGVAYRENVDEVMTILKEVATKLQEDPELGSDILEPLEMLGVDQFADSAVIIKCRITTKPIRQWAIGREMNRRIKQAFDAHGIEIPFPHRTIYWGEPKEGTAPPLHVVNAAAS
jgi:small conductance mechanosensitive channel